MSDLTEKQWEEYLAKEHRDVMWRALAAVRSAQASLQVTGQEDLYKECDGMAIEIEARIKKLYEMPTV